MSDKTSEVSRLIDIIRRERNKSAGLEEQLATNRELTDKLRAEVAELRGASNTPQD